MMSMNKLTEIKVQRIIDHTGIIEMALSYADARKLCHKLLTLIEEMEESDNQVLIAHWILSEQPVDSFGFSGCKINRLDGIIDSWLQKVKPTDRTLDKDKVHERILDFIDRIADI